MKALVTGGAGYIGSHLCDALLERGHSVAAIDNLSTGSAANVAHLAGHPRFLLVRGSILDCPDLEVLVSQADMVFHLAAAVGVKYICDDPLGGITTNIRGTERVLELCHRTRCRTVIASSSEVYGKSDGRPLREDADRILGPTTINRWSYSVSKAVDEHLAYAYAALGLPVTVVRYFNSYGPRLSESGYGSVVANFARQALQREPITVHGDGMQTRSFTYVGDTVRGTILAAEVPEAAGDVFNIGSEYETTILDLAHMVREMTGSPAEVLHVPHRSYYGESYEDTARRRPDPTKSARVLGFRASTSLERGLEATLDWCRRHYRAGQAARTEETPLPFPVLAPQPA